MTPLQNRVINVLIELADYLGQLPHKSKGAELRKEIIAIIDILDIDPSSPKLVVAKDDPLTQNPKK